MALLELKNLKVYFKIMKGIVHAVDNVSLTLEQGETLGLVGESGCGKTTTAFAIMRLLPENGYIVDGEIWFRNRLVSRREMGIAGRVRIAVKEEKNWPEVVRKLLRHHEQELKISESKKSVGERRLMRLRTKILSFERAELKAVSAKFNSLMAKRKDLEYKKKKFETWLEKIENSSRSLKLRKAIVTLAEEEMRTIRWKHVSIIFQGAMNAFNPVFRVGDQIAEALMLHETVGGQKMSKRKALEKVKNLFRLVGLDPGRITGYPHEFSGGMKQRAMIAMALACSPSLIIADEPTTALDVIMQDRILMEIKKLQKRLNLAMIIITHDISVVAETAERIAIMYAGKIMELGSTEAIFKRPAHPYTLGLMNAFPSIKGEKKILESISGSPPDLTNPPAGCRFHPRCKFVKDICSKEEPIKKEVEANHFSMCHFAEDVFRESIHTPK